MGRRPESQVCVPSLFTSPLWASVLSCFPMRGSNSAGSGEPAVKPPASPPGAHSSSPLPGRGPSRGWEPTLRHCSQHLSLRQLSPARRGPPDSGHWEGWERLEHPRPYAQPGPGEVTLAGAPDNPPGWGLWALYPASCQGSQDNQDPTSTSQPQGQHGLGPGVLMEWVCSPLPSTFQGGPLPGRAGDIFTPASLLPTVPGEDGGGVLPVGS